MPVTVAVRVTSCPAIEGNLLLAISIFALPRSKESDTSGDVLGAKSVMLAGVKTADSVCGVAAARFAKNVAVPPEIRVVVLAAIGVPLS